MKANDGGPAGNLGLSVRDYFAAQALAGLVANNTLTWVPSGPYRSGEAAVAAQCYVLADALLEARGQGLEEPCPPEPEPEGCACGITCGCGLCHSRDCPYAYPPTNERCSLTRADQEWWAKPEGGIGEGRR